MGYLDLREFFFFVKSSCISIRPRVAQKSKQGNKKQKTDSRNLHVEKSSLIWLKGFDSLVMRFFTQT